MKTRMLIAGCGVSLCSLAHAQSSVTLWGQVDSGISYVSNVKGGATVGTASGIGAPTRWGLTGSEDLGGGYRSVFALEEGFNINAGTLITSNTLFDREAYVGIQSPYGELDIGRHSDLMSDIALRYSNAFWNRNLYTFHAGNLDGLSNSAQIQNAVTYKSPSLYGFHVGGMYGFAGGTAEGHTSGGYVTYDNGPFSAGITYMTTKDRVLNMYTFFGFTSFLGQSLSSTKTFMSNEVNNLGIGATYKITDNWLVNALFTSTQIKGASEQTHLDNQDVGTIYHINSANAVTLDYTYSWMGSDHWNMMSAGYLYNFSKATQAQVTLTDVKASGSGATAATFPNGNSSNQSQLIAHVGITHSF